MAYKATIVSQSGKSYKISIKKGADETFIYRSYKGTDKHAEDMQALEDEFNDTNKKADRDARKQERKDAKNVDSIQDDIDKAIKKMSYKIPKGGNSTKAKTDTLKAALQAAVDAFIGSL